MSMRMPIIALAVLAAAAPAMAQQSAPKSNLSRHDRNFAEEAMADGAAEVQMGKLALERAQSPAVKDLAQRLIADHSQANQQLNTIASQQGIAAADTLPREQRREIDKLSKLQGADFDRAFMAAIVDDHKKDIKAFQEQANKGGNADLKSFAQAQVPTLQQHLTAAQQAQAALKSGQQARTPD